MLADDLGINRETEKSNNKRVGEYSFDSDRKLMSTLYAENGKHTVFTKGALGSLLTISTQVLEKGKVISITDEHRKKYLAAAENMAGNALRT